MQQRFGVVQSSTGTAIGGALVTVKTYPGGVNATLYSDNGVTPASNPVVANATGEYSYYAANGRYTESITGTGFTSETNTDVVILYDPADGAAFTVIAPKDGVTSAQADVAAWVAAAYTAGADLYWPAGTYLTTASIPNLHSVRHYGPGVIKRGSDLFHPCPKSGQTNTVYVSASGSASNDGLSASQPISTVQGGFNALSNYGPFLEGTWILQLAAGTYAAASQLVGLRSRNRIQIKGPSVGGHPNVPTAIVDGNGLSSSVGMYLQSGVYASLQDIKFKDWTYGTTSAFGLVADGHCDIITTNVHTINCYYAGVSCDNLTQLRMQGGIIDGSTFYGVRCYSQVSASVGYSGSSVGDSTIIRNCGAAGVYGANSSRVHVDYADINNNPVGLFVEKNTRAVANYTLFDTNTVAVRYDQNSVYGESGATNTFTSNGKNYVGFGSEDDVSAFQRFWDRTTQRTLFGATAYRSVNAKWEWQLDSTASGSSYNSNVKAVFDSNSTPAYIGLSGSAAAQVGFLWSTVAKSAQASLNYVFSDDSMRIGVNGLTTGYRFTSGKFGPDQDNSKTLGDSSFRWSNVFTNQLTAKPPASATPAANGDMLFELTSDTTLKIKVKGSDGTVRSVSLTLA